MCVLLTPPPKVPPDIVHQHGQPLEVIDMGETAIDEEAFNEYLEEIRQHYTADKVRSDASTPSLAALIFRAVSSARYVLNGSTHWRHPMIGTDFNCNSFTNDVIGFLTGGSIPERIKGTKLPLYASEWAHNVLRSSQ